MTALQYEYSYSSTPEEPPANNQVRFDDVDTSLATKMWVRYSSATGEDLFRPLMTIAVGDEVYIQDWDDHTVYDRFAITSAGIDKGTYAEFGVSSLVPGTSLSAGGKVSFVIITGVSTPVIPPFARSGVTPAMVRLVYPTSLTDPALEQLITQAEAELAAVIGPLTGPIQQRFSGTGVTSMILARRVVAGDLLLSAGGGPVPGTDWLLSIDGRRVDSLAVSPWSGLVATYTPSDLPLVQSTVIDMTILSASMSAAGGYTSEHLGEYSYQTLSPVALEATRRAMFRRFKYLGFGPAYTTRLVPVGVMDP